MPHSIGNNCKVLRGPKNAMSMYMYTSTTVIFILDFVKLSIYT